MYGHIMNLRLNLKWIDEALRLASQAAEIGEVPVGAVIVKDNRIIAAAYNRTINAHDPCGHAEILAIRQAAQHLQSERLIGCDIWVTLEPCAMCAGAIAHARLERLYFGAEDPKGGAVEHGPIMFAQPTIHHRPEVYGGLKAKESAKLLREFFAARR